ncbi:hypothetical protein ALI144C_00355 [Actinosynnema sp. ALI-1.44]|nr:hypothetical protein ALI144C_00355 [Actinosynnema sp. ALI-1.44]
MAALVVAAVAVGVWALLRFGVPVWLSDDKHPVRPVVEGLSWVAAVLGLLLAVAAFVLQLRSQNRSAAAGPVAVDAVQPDGQPVGNRGVSIEGGVHGYGPGATFGAVSGGHVNIGESPPDPPGPARR